MRMVLQVLSIGIKIKYNLLLTLLEAILRDLPLTG